MCSSRVSTNGKSVVQPDWAKQFDEWRELLARCENKAARKRVHALRVAMLRLRAEVDFRLLDQESTSGMNEAARRWNKQADKLRKALSPVRDTDVHIELLEKLRASNGSTGGNSRLTPAFLEEIEDLTKRLREERRSAEKTLLREIGERRDRLERTSKDVAGQFTRQTTWSESDRSRLIRSTIAGLATEVAGLNADTLHAFRKQAKTARYLADVSAKSDPLVGRQAALLKKMQNAAGKWHDLQTLAERSEQILGKDHMGELFSILQRLSDESLESALDVCRDTMRELLAHGAWIGASASALPPKKPVRSVASPAAAETYRPAYI
jgi:CHAD domain-containing protein